MFVEPNKWKKTKALEPFQSYKEFTADDILSNEDATDYKDRAYIEWCRDHYGQWLAPHQTNPIGRSHDPLADAVKDRAGWGYLHPDENRDTIIQQAMQKPIALIPDDIVVFRVTTMSELMDLTGGHRPRQGNVLRIPYLWSTSLIKDGILQVFRDKPTKNVLVTLYIPAKTRGLYIDYLSHRFDEQEMLLAAGVSIRILWVDRPRKKIKLHIYAVAITQPTCSL